MTILKWSLLFAVFGFVCAFKVESNETTKRIIGGETAKPGQFPYMASLQKIKTNEHICGYAILK